MDEIVRPFYVARPVGIERQRCFARRSHLREKLASGATLTPEQELRLAELEEKLKYRIKKAPTTPDFLPFICSQKALDRADESIHFMRTHRREGGKSWNPLRLNRFTKNMSTLELRIFLLLLGKEIEVRVRDDNRHELNEARHAVGLFGPLTQIELIRQRETAAMTRRRAATPINSPSTFPPGELQECQTTDKTYDETR